MFMKNPGNMTASPHVL